MKDAILLELASRWERDAKAPNAEDSSDDAKIRNAVAKGIREGKRECADGIRMMVQLLGGADC